MRRFDEFDPSGEWLDYMAQADYPWFTDWLTQRDQEAEARGAEIGWNQGYVDGFWARDIDNPYEKGNRNG